MNSESENLKHSLAEEAIDWLVLMRSGSVSAESRREFEQWLQLDPSHRVAYEEAETLLGSIASILQETHNIVPQHRPMARSYANSNERSAYRNLRFASAASLVLGAWICWTPISDYLLSDYSTKIGEQKQVVLSDGSSVFMNTDTAISLDLRPNSRKVVLRRGQAEFKVAKDPSRPFEVVTETTTIRALGTIFEVFEHDSKAVDVNVSEHAVSVRLQGKTGVESIRVEEGERLHYAGNGELNRPQLVDLNQFHAWRRGKLIFRDQPLMNVIAELNRYSTTKILINGEEIGKMRVSGVFPINSMEILGALQKTFPIHSTQFGSWLVILHS